MSKKPTSVEMSFTEIRRTGAGTLEDVQTVVRWTGVEHTSPQGDIDLHLKVNLVRKEMPGSNQVVHQVLASTWQPFDINGEWDDKWGNRLLNTSDGPFAAFTFQEFAKFTARAPLTRWEMDGLSFVGIISDLKVKYRRQTKIFYAITFSPENNEVTQIKPRVSVASQSLPKWIEDAGKQRDALNTAFGTLKNLALKTPRVDIFTRSLLDINDAVDRLQGINATAFDVDAEQKLLLLATTFRRLRGASYDAALALGRVTTSDDIAFSDVLLSMRHAEWVSSSVTISWQCVGTATKAELDARRRARQKPRAIYYPRRNESLERISLKFYGTPDNWRAIYDRNNLSSYQLDGSEELVIPERAS